MKKRKRSPSVTLVMQRDGTTRTRAVRIPIWALHLGAWMLGAVIFLLVVITALYGPLVAAAARVPGMQRELARLRAENSRVRELSAALDSAESRYTQLRQMMGGRILRDPVAKVSQLPIAPPIRARLIQGLDITRGQVKPGGRDGPHRGLDIAVAVGSPVRASGGGIVSRAGEDPEYGLYVLLQHPGEYLTMYGHLSRILVAAESTVAPRQVIGLSGNSGRSTAPHLHFEIRQREASLDPLTLVKEGR
jgi:murein DD-endopeptidase MepM/ murein hydrolase activator NlpD